MKKEKKDNSQIIEIKESVRIPNTDIILTEGDKIKVIQEQDEKSKTKKE